MAQVRDGVVRIETLSCGDGWQGTGFLSDGMIVTAAHVVDEAVTIGLSTGASRTTGAVVGIDHDLDLALVQPNGGIQGHDFEFAPGRARIGEAISVLGYPRGLPFSAARGTVSGFSPVSLNSGVEQDYLQTDTAVNPGNSGGPMIDDRGRVLGIASFVLRESEGLNFGLPAGAAAPLVEQWSANPRVVTRVSCERPEGAPIEIVDLGDPPDIDPGVVDSIEMTLTAYFDGINTYDFERAWGQLSPNAQARSDFDEFVSATFTSYDHNFVVHDVQIPGPDHVQVWLTFTSLQEPGAGPDGEACTNWSLDYQVRLFDGLWLIDRVTPHEGDGHVPC